jgi:hypothetical protein
MSRPRFRHAAPRRRVSPLVVAAAGLALLVAASYVVARTGDRPTRGDASRDRQVVTVGPREPSASATADQVAADIAWPTDLTWITVAGLDLPVSATAGPRDLAGGRARGFSQTPAGAVLAALHLLVRSSPQVGPRVWEPTLREQVVGPDVAAYTDAVNQDYETARERLQVPYGEPLGRIYASIGGVRVDAYSPQAASLRVLIEAPGGDGGIARAATVVQVSWSGTDWQLIAPPRGDWSTVRVLISADLAAGYTPLPGR